jgi:glutamate racemase
MVRNAFAEAVLHAKITRWQPIENNEYKTEGAKYFIKKNVQNLMMADEQIDTFILGCTHYPLIAEQVRGFAGRRITIFSQGEIVAKKLKEYLQRHPEMDEKCTKSGICDYFTTESTEKFNTSASIFLKGNINAQHIDLE